LLRTGTLGTIILYIHLRANQFLSYCFKFKYTSSSELSHGTLGSGVTFLLLLNSMKVQNQWWCDLIIEFLIIVHIKSKKNVYQSKTKIPVFFQKTWHPAGYVMLVLWSPFCICWIEFVLICSPARSSSIWSEGWMGWSWKSLRANPGKQSIWSGMAHRNSDDNSPISY